MATFPDNGKKIQDSSLWRSIGFNSIREILCFPVELILANGIRICVHPCTVQTRIYRKKLMYRGKLMETFIRCRRKRPRKTASTNIRFHLLFFCANDLCVRLRCLYLPKFFPSCWFPVHISRNLLFTISGSALNYIAPLRRNAPGI